MSQHVTIPEGTPVVQKIIKGDVSVIPITTGGEGKVSGAAWRCLATKAVPGTILPLLETYLVSEPHQLPWNFVSWVSDCACEALTNAGQHSRPGTDVQISCYVVGTGDDRHCTVKVFNFVEVGTKLFPDKEDIPRPDEQDVMNLRSRGLPIMKFKADELVLEDLPGYAKDVTLGFSLKNAPAE